MMALPIQPPPRSATVTDQLPTKTPFHTRFSPEAVRLLKAVADKRGISMTAVLEMEIREAAKREKIK